MMAVLAADLELERQPRARRLGRRPTRAEFAEDARRRFRSDPAFRRTIMAAKAQIEAEKWQARVRLIGG
jgi:hypothetical protein